MEEDKSNNTGCGCSIETVFWILLVLKLFGIISISWGWVVLAFILAIL